MVYGILCLSVITYTDLISDLKQKIKKLSKPIVITIEDIDRIQYADIILKIFSIAENLVDTNEKNIKFIYQYDEK